MPLIDLGDLAPFMKWVGGLFTLSGIVAMFGWFLALTRLQKFLTTWEVLLNKRSADLEKIAQELKNLSCSPNKEETK